MGPFSFSDFGMFLSVSYGVYTYGILRVCWGFTWGILGVYWEYTGSILRVYWEYTGGIPGYTGGRHTRSILYV